MVFAFKVRLAISTSPVGSIPEGWHDTCFHVAVSWATVTKRRGPLQSDDAHDHDGALQGRMLLSRILASVCTYHSSSKISLYFP
jgi:hypothetical protein